MATTHTVSNTAELVAALKVAQGGDTVQLLSGNYGNLSLKNLTFADTVTVTTADPATEAMFRSISLYNCDHLTFDGVTVQYGAAGAIHEKSVSIKASDHIRITNSEIIGNPQTAAYADVPRGIQVELGSEHIEIDNNSFRYLSRGVVSLGTNYLTVAESDLQDMRQDGVFINANNHVLIQNNHMTNFHPQAGDHADFIQFEPGQGVPDTDVVVRGNVLLAGSTGGHVQGIFADASGVEGSFQNFTIENNIYFGNSTHGVTIYDGTGISVTKNTILSVPGSSNTASILMRGVQVDTIVEDNVVNQVGNPLDNFVVQWSDPSLPNYYGNLFTNPFAQVVDVADLAPLAGSPIYYGSQIGAEARFAELLGAMQDFGLDHGDALHAVAHDSSDDISSDDVAPDNVPLHTLLKLALASSGPSIDDVLQSVVKDHVLFGSDHQPASPSAHDALPADGHAASIAGELAAIHHGTGPELSQTLFDV